uniref:Candidate secreted effector n=1 Tax=Meloidogyne incognita TaxID=6306 RepID=A0A914LSX7_MELIC
MIGGGLVFAQMETQLEGGSGERIKRFGYWSGGGHGGGHGIHGGGGGHHGWH